MNNQVPSVNGMTQFELEIMNKYISMNDLIFNYRKDDIALIRNGANKAIEKGIMEDTSIVDKVELNYIQMVSEVVDEIRRENDYSEELISDIIKMLNQYYSMVFSKLNMVQSTNGELSSYDLCLNYRNCKVAAEELAMLMKQKEQLKKI